VVSAVQSVIADVAIAPTTLANIAPRAATDLRLSTTAYGVVSE
jgi:hypothetical protein